MVGVAKDDLRLHLFAKFIEVHTLHRASSTYRHENRSLYLSVVGSDDASTCIRRRVGMLEFEFHYSFFSSSIVKFIGLSTNSLVSAISHTS